MCPRNQITLANRADPVLLPAYGGGHGLESKRADGPGPTSKPRDAGRRREKASGAHRRSRAAFLAGATDRASTDAFDGLKEGGRALAANQDGAGRHHYGQFQPRLPLVKDLKDAPASPPPLCQNRDFQLLRAGQVVSSAAGTQPS